MQDVSQDTDDMYDDLFKKHGKVVFSRKDQKSARAEIDDDAESLSCKLINNKQIFGKTNAHHAMFTFLAQF